MTLIEAWSELGVEPGADAETVRRAYLRLIKTRKPEADPDGFQRARLAYEIARASGEIEGFAARSVQAGNPAAADPTPDAASAVDAEPRPSATDAAFQGFLTAWNAVPPSADQRPRLEIAREAVLALPQDPRARWLLVTTLSRLGTESDLADALREGWRAGWPEFLEALLVRLPGRASRDEIDAAFAAEPASLRLAAAAAAAVWQDARSAELVAELCRAAVADVSDAHGERVRELPMGRMLDVILALHAAGALDAAARAHGEVRRCLHDTGLELAMANGPLGGVWTLAEEIDGLPTNFPQPLRAAFARATRAGDLAGAYYDTVGYLELHRATVEEWAPRLAGSAPNVTGVLRAALARQHAARAETSKATWGRFWWVFLVFGLPALGRMCTESNHAPLTRNDLDFSSARPTVPLPSVPGMAPSPAVDMLDGAAADLCGSTGPRHGQLVCADVEALVSALSQHDCVGISGRLRRIVRTLESGGATELVARFATRAELARWQVCPTVRSSGSGDPGP